MLLCWCRCVYDVKLLEDGRLLSADHAGHVRQWSSGELVGGRHRHHCLTLGPAFAPSVDDPASALIDLELRGCERLCVRGWLDGVGRDPGGAAPGAHRLRRATAALGADGARLLERRLPPAWRTPAGRPHAPRGHALPGRVPDAPGSGGAGQRGAPVPLRTVSGRTPEGQTCIPLLR